MPNTKLLVSFPSQTKSSPNQQKRKKPRFIMQCRLNEEAFYYSA